jgi:hypothetical protein
VLGWLAVKDTRRIRHGISRLASYIERIGPAFIQETIMSRRLALFALAAGAALPLACATHAQDAFTTRIEPQPFYGATVTIESGVRVFRPLPATRQVIVNPGGMTPLNLGYYDTRVTEQSTSTNYNYNTFDAPPVSAGGVVGGFGFPRRFDGRRHDGHPRRFPDRGGMHRPH